MPKIFEKLLRAGEGRILKKLEGIAAQVNALEEDFEKLTDEELRNETDVFRQAAGRRRDPRRPPARGVRRGPRGQQAHPRQAALRRADHGWGGPAHGQRRRDEDR